jgi:hypothetical protein
MSKVFPAGGITTQGHWLVDTEWQYRNAVVKMHDDGFSCSCKKNPIKPCSHIKNVKLRLYGTFDEHYLREEV